MIALMKTKQKPQRPALEEFLEHGGAEMLPITNPWELVRFKTPRGTHIIYNNSKGNKSYSDEYANEAYQAYIDRKPWIAKEKVNRRSQSYLIEAIKKRDGNECFFCRVPFDEETGPTIEHLLAITSGGSNGIANLTLAHKECNMKAGSLSVMEKIKIREQSSRDRETV